MSYDDLVKCNNTPEVTKIETKSGWWFSNAYYPRCFYEQDVYV